MYKQPNDYAHRAGVTAPQKQILNAIEAGHLRMRAIQVAAGISSTSVVRYNLQVLAMRGDLILEERGDGGPTQIYDGRDYASAWDSAARLAGNPDA